MGAAGNTKDGGKPSDVQAASNGQALSDIPALKPYWGKPAVRNFREGHGNVGIIRSPLRAIALPDPSLGYHCAGIIAECVNDPAGTGRSATCENWDSGQFALEG